MMCLGAANLAIFLLGLLENQWFDSQGELEYFPFPTILCRGEEFVHRRIVYCQSVQGNWPGGSFLIYFFIESMFICIAI